MEDLKMFFVGLFYFTVSIIKGTATGEHPFMLPAFCWAAFCVITIFVPYKIKLKPAKKYENRKSPIYKIDKDNYIHKYTADWHLPNPSAFILIIPFMLLFTKFRYEEVGSIQSHLPACQIEDLAVYYEAMVAEKELIIEMEKKALEVYDKLNTEFKENYV